MRRSSPGNEGDYPVFFNSAFRETFVAKPGIRHTGIVDVEFGKDVPPVQPLNLYGCAIGDGSFAGPFWERTWTSIVRGLRSSTIGAAIF
jgi:hypothetical protein